MSLSSESWQIIAKKQINSISVDTRIQVEYRPVEGLTIELHETDQQEISRQLNIALDNIHHIIYKGLK